MEVSIQIENNFSKLINYQILHVETQNTFRSRERATSGAPCPALTFVLSRVYIYTHTYTRDFRSAERTWRGSPSFPRYNRA